MPLFILPFDHRATFAKELLGFPYPDINKSHKKSVSEMKQIIFDAFLVARKQADGSDDCVILVDEEFGEPIIKSARKRKIAFAVSAEKSGQKVFDFEYGRDFGKHILALRPTYAKALVRYDVADVDNNTIQRKRLKLLSDFCARHGIKLMIEILLSGKGVSAKRMECTIQEIIRDGIAPAVWKLEGLETFAAWKKIKQLTTACIIVLGRGESKKIVLNWVRVAAGSGAVDGFAIGRTIFFKALADYRDKKIDRASAVGRIAENFLFFINEWKKLS